MMATALSYLKAAAVAPRQATAVKAGASRASEKPPGKPPGKFQGKYSGQARSKTSSDRPGAAGASAGAAAEAPDRAGKSSSTNAEISPTRDPVENMPKKKWGRSDVRSWTEPKPATTSLGARAEPTAEASSESGALGTEPGATRSTAARAGAAGKVSQVTKGKAAAIRAGGGVTAQPPAVMVDRDGQSRDVSKSW